MSDAKHTPGPWAFSTDPGGWEFYIHQADGAPYTPDYSDVAGIRIAHTVDGERKAIQEANAHLIAAAPDLLEALEQARQCLHDIATAKEGDRWGWDWESVISDADNAIAKARGEA